MSSGPGTLSGLPNGRRAETTDRFYRVLSRTCSSRLKTKSPKVIGWLPDGRHKVPTPVSSLASLRPARRRRLRVLVSTGLSMARSLRVRASLTNSACCNSSWGRPTGRAAHGAASACQSVPGGAGTAPPLSSGASPAGRRSDCSHDQPARAGRDLEDRLSRPAPPGPLRRRRWDH